jgi:outer membrane protein assembly factor BamB/tetratricopeptide (TPR) repeat protein
MMKRRPATRFPALALCWLVAGSLAALDFDARSLALRTALHQDAALEAPFDELRALYREAGREAELVELYRTHLAQYPGDQGARAVHLRLLLAVDAPEAVPEAASALKRHPENAYLHYLAFRATGNLEPLSRGIALEAREDRRGAWLRELLECATGAGERGLAATQLVAERDRRLADGGHGLPELLEWMSGFAYAEVARETLVLAGKGGLDPETELELAFRAVRVEPREAALARVEGLLSRLAADHPRRADLVRARRSLGDPAKLLAGAREAVRADPVSAAAAVDLATLLEAEGAMTGAGEVLAEAALRLPHLAWLEERARSLLASAPAKWREYVRRRASLDPGRSDLARELTLLTFALDGTEAGRKAVEAGIAQGDSDSLTALGTALAARGFAEGAVLAFREALRLAPKRFAPAEGLIRALAARGDEGGVAGVIGGLSFDGIPAESWTRLASFLEAEGFASAARELLERGLAARPGAFEATLALAKVSPPARGEELLDQSRALATDGESYRDWLIAAVEFAAGQGRAESVWGREEARFSSGGDGLGEAAVQRVSAFVSVALERSQENRARRVTGRLLEEAGTEVDKRPDLQRLAVTVFTGDRSKAPETERYLLSLLEGKDGPEDDLRLRLALLYGAVGRPDFAEPQLERIDWAAVDSIPLLDAAVAAFPGRRMRLWPRLVALRPADKATWQGWLNGLWKEGRDAEFRAAAGKLIAENAPFELSEAVRAVLGERIDASWQREVEWDLRRGEAEAALRKLRLLARGTPPDWVGWTGARLLEEAGRKEEAETWWARIGGPQASALRALGSDPWPSVAPAPQPPAPLARVAWRFQPLPGARVSGVVAVGATVAVLDDHHRLVGLQSGTGKLLWENELQAEVPPGRDGAAPRTGLIVAPDLVADAGKLFVPAGDRVLALDASSGRTLWESRLGPVSRLALAGPDLLMVLNPSEATLAALDRAQGKLRWIRKVDPSITRLPAESVGFAASGPVVALWLDRLTLFRAATGDPLWSRGPGDLGPLDLEGRGPETVGSGRRHLAFHGDRVVAMGDGLVFSLGVAFPGGGETEIEGIHLGGDGARVCFQTERGVEFWEPATGHRGLLNGSGEAILISGDRLLRGGPGRLAAWDFRTGRKLWETALASGPAGPAVGSGSHFGWWRGPVSEERWQGFVIRRSVTQRAVGIPGGVAVAGEKSVEGWMP